MAYQCQISTKMNFLYQDFLSNKKEARIVREFFEENVSKLNQGKKVVFDTIIGRVNQKEGGLIFLDIFISLAGQEWWMVWGLFSWYWR